MSPFVLVMVKGGKLCVCSIRYFVFFVTEFIYKVLSYPVQVKTFVLQGTLSGSYNFENLAVSTEALRSSYQTKVQLLLILIETLDLESLLQMVHDAIPFRFLAS